MRKTSLVRITDGTKEINRDFGKTFVIKEMPASVAERWATRALLALARSGIDLPESAMGGGWAALAVAGFQALSHANFSDIEPLLDEMWQCVSICPDMRHPEIIRALMWAGADGEGADIEEVATLIKLRGEVFTLHSGFFIPGVNSTSSISGNPTSGDLSNTQIQQPNTATPSRRFSPPGKRR